MERFADWYTDTIFPLWTGTLGRVTSLVPFSVGELLLVAALIWVLAFLITLLHHLITLLPFIKKHRKQTGRYPHFRRRFYKVTGITALVVAVIMILNCFLSYRCSPMDARVRSLLPETEAEKELSNAPDTLTDTERLTLLRDYAVNFCNEIAKELPRDENGDLLPEAVPTDDVILQKAQTAIAALSPAYPRLGHYQVRPKPLLFSAFVSQQYMQGYYFPFSMEANYNDLIVRTNLPFAVTHELAHTHGYLREDECNFLAFLACTHTDDVFFRYSGWISVLSYLNRDFKKSVSKDEYALHPAISKEVQLDARFLTADTWAKVKKKSPLKTETVQKAANTYVDTTLKLNGVASGKESYSEVVALLFTYYFD